MSTKKSERIKVWIVTILMLAGTAVSLVAMALSVKNQSTDQEKYYQEYLEQQKISSQLNADNSEALIGYESRTFDESGVSDLKVEILSQGEGAEIKETDTIEASYFGWLSDGKIFDSSKKKNSEDAPATFSLSQVISGWTKGIAGQKVGSVLRLTIPSNMAYGSAGQGIIPANAPLEFVVNIHQIVEEEADNE